jgi:peptide/nickel transport system substrate-binding protein
MDSFSRIRIFLTRTYRIKPFEKLEGIFRSFSIAEKTVYIIGFILLTFSTLSLLAKINDTFLIEVPAHGGTLSEGIVGTPRFVNPLLAVSDADRDLSSLVYSGLMRATPDGGFIPDLALRYSVSSDGLTYTFILRDDAVFQDNTPVTADDVEFTVTKAQDSMLKSPKRLNWEGVKVEKSGEREIKFILKQPYSPFIANATLGILPRHIWKTLENDQFPFSQYNVNPVGSGPYRVDSLTRSKDGIPTSYSLRAFDAYTLGKPYIENLEFSFFSNENTLVDALLGGSIEGASNISAHTAVELEKEKVRLLRAPLTRVFGIFFNQNQKEVLAHREVRDALDTILDKQAIVEKVLEGSGTVASSPLPPTVAEKVSGVDEDNIISTSTIDAVLADLKKSGWTKTATSSLTFTKGKVKSTLALSLTTSNVPELVETADMVAESWRSLGVSVDVKVFEPSDLNQAVIRPRRYDALLFGLVVGRDPDLYAFWHSSQRNDPGLNIAMYTNAKADKALEDIRKATSTDVVRLAYDRFNKEVSTDVPTVFLFSPDFIYAVPDKIQNVRLGQITTPNDRFFSIHDWYIETEKVWKFLSDRKD